MTIGTSIIFGSFTFTCHAPVPTTGSSGGSKVVRVRRTDDKESRGSFRCGFYFEFYRALHHVSNELELLPAPRIRSVSPIPRPACPWPRARQHVSAPLPYPREFAGALPRDS